MAMAKPTIGRPRRTEAIKTIKLRASTFDLWNERKHRLGIDGITNSEFAEILLHQDLEALLRDQRQLQSISARQERQTTRSGRRQLFVQSTPVGKGQLGEIGISPVVDTESNIEVDITVDSTKYSQETSCGHVTLAEKLHSLNPGFCTLEGNPFPEVNNPENSDYECLSSSSDISIESDPTVIDDEQSMCSAENDSDGIRSEEELEESMEVDNEQYFSRLDSATLTAIEMELSTTNQEALPPDEGEPEVISAGPSSSISEFGPITFDQYKEDVKASIKQELEGLKLPSGDLLKFREMFRANRVVVEVDKVMELFDGQCPEMGCTSKRQVSDMKLEAGVLTVSYICTNGHSGIWNSSMVLAEKRGQKLFVSSVLLASSVLVSGNNFAKICLLAKSLNLSFVSSTTFSRIQSLYALPSIRDLWSKMKERIWKVFEKDALVLCGDGRMDSPGFSAKYCVYTMMEHFLNVIIDLEVVDKREAGGSSTLMEKIGCKRLLEKIMSKLSLSELVTDASRVIMKMIRDLKDNLQLKKLQQVSVGLTVSFK